MAGPSTALPRLLPAPSRRRLLPAFLGAALARPGLTLAG